MVQTGFTLRNVHFNNRVLVASGTFGYGDELAESIDLNGIGGIITKSLTLFNREGNPPPRIVETPSGLLNSIGLANIGVEKFINEKLQILKKLETVIIANIAGSSIDEYCSVVEKLENVVGIDAYEINISCPNVREGALAFGTDVNATAKITRKIRGLTNKPIIVKLTPNVTRVSELALAAETEGADAVSIINTLIGIAVDVKTQKPKLSTITGGLSGPAIKPIALAKVYEVVQVVKIPVIGIGGILTTEDALEFLIIGASAIQVGTGNFINPTLPLQIASGIVEYCIAKNFQDTKQLIGTFDISDCIPVLKSWL